ncbi:54S ribosomal protein L31, mitochondrial [Cytospora mali]|uniref:54S ribosomal protein L31, mitochondrial n=1 Tax=Cytospora mali TaxID=578113 RepID=A0A194VKM6_CYTMA|nr:54S ribosomal protein L31, mitochondrial [Valsa mali]
MFGPFRLTNPLRSGLLWKTTWRLSKFQKRRQRHRLRAVDSVVETLETALAKKGETVKAVERWRAEMPREDEMLAKDKYTIFDRKEKRIAKVDESFSAIEPTWILDDDISGANGTTRLGSDSAATVLRHPIHYISTISDHSRLSGRRRAAMWIELEAGTPEYEREGMAYLEVRAEED